MDLLKMNETELRGEYRKVRKSLMDLIPGYTSDQFDKDILREMDLFGVDHSPRNSVIAAHRWQRHIMMEAQDLNWEESDSGIVGAIKDLTDKF